MWPQGFYVSLTESLRLCSSPLNVNQIILVWHNTLKHTYFSVPYACLVNETNKHICMIASSARNIANYLPDTKNNVAPGILSHLIHSVHSPL